MANIIQIKRGTSVPTISALEDYELGYCTTGKALYINDDGTIRLTGLPISGGTITGNLTVDGTLNRSCLSAYEHSCTGIYGGVGYVLAIRITVLGGYQNTPILFDVIQRGGAAYQIKIMLTNTSSINPNLSSFKSYGNGGTRAWIYKSADSTFDIYIQKVEAYDTIGISRASCFSTTQRATSQIKYEYLNVMATTLPDGAVQSTNYSMETVPSATDVGALPITGGNITGSLKIQNNSVYHVGNKPTKSDIGLGNVNNWGASTSVSSTSTTTYATSSAVKSAYDRGTSGVNAAATKLPLSGGTLTGDLNFYGRLGTTRGTLNNQIVNGTETVNYIGNPAKQTYIEGTSIVCNGNNIYHTGYKNISMSQTFSGSASSASATGTFIIFTATPNSSATPVTQCLMLKNSTFQVADNNSWSSFTWNGSTLSRVSGTGLIKNVQSFTIR